MIDTHCHIYGPKYDEDRDEVLRRAQEAGVLQILVVGCDVSDSRRALTFASAHEGVYCAVGVHPHHADLLDDRGLANLERMANDPKVLALGEMGLDYYYDNSPRPVQQDVFTQQLQLAQQLGMPVVIHTRDAENDTTVLLSRMPPPKGGHVHCFTGSRPFAKKLLDLDLHIGFTGIITFPNAHELREVAAFVPLDRLLIETDSPYLAPVPNRGQRNEPAFVRHVAESVAEAKGVSIEEVLTVTTENYFKLYGADQTHKLQVTA